MSDGTQYDFLYVQRLELPDGDRPGLKAAYMGSITYELGTPKSYRRMTSQRLDLTSRAVRYNGVEEVVFFLGEQVSLQEKIDDFLVWIESDMPYREDTSYFQYQFGLKKPSWLPPTVGWLAINDDLVWSLRTDVLSRFSKGLSYGL